jgi:uncharacterized membrane protein YfcA
MEVSASALIILGLAALGTGVSKTGIPGLGIIFVVLTPLVMPAKVSTGYILPFLIFGDVLAILVWRKTAVWRLIAAVLPAMLAGVIAGYFLMDRIPEAVYGKVLGSVVLFLAALDWVCRRRDVRVPEGSRTVSRCVGFLAGMMTMLANAAGPVVMLYLLAMRVTKEQFVGTGAWLYFMINLFKVPFSVALGLITPESLKVNFMMLPLVLCGGLIGLAVMRRIPAGVFEGLMRVFVFLGGVKLLF